MPASLFTGIALHNAANIKLIEKTRSHLLEYFGSLHCTGGAGRVSLDCFDDQRHTPRAWVF
jgi:hypothetical protein